MFLDLHAISRWYGKQQALCDVTLRLEPGRIGLLGPNGAGKSTLLKILLGLLPPSSGSGRVLGHDLLGDGTALRRAIGYMSEADALLPGMCGADYVALAGELYGMPRLQARRRAHEVLTCLGLGDARYRKLEEYSTGMKQRLKLAQALVHDPPVLLLDEPTSALDLGRRVDALELVDELRRERGLTVVSALHDLTLAGQFADRLILLFAGKVVAEGPPHEVLQAGLLSAHFGSRVRVLRTEDGELVVVPQRVPRATGEGSTQCH
jgi:ABC-2 type transport system ATP-binding protein